MLTQLIYISSPVHAHRQDVCESIPNFVKQNKASNVTGVLIATDTFFLQLIEGRREFVNKLYNLITKDTRHRNVTMLRYQEIRKLEFVDNTMVYLDHESSCLEFLKDIDELNSVNFDTMTSVLAMAILRRAVALHRCMSYPNRRKTDIAEIPNLLQQSQCDS